MHEFTDKELATLRNAEFFRTKVHLDAKIKAIFTELKQQIAEIHRNATGLFADQLRRQPGRLYQGENHQGFPWRAVDALRFKQGENLFLFRGLMVYGHHCSLHLIFDGPLATRLTPKILSARESLDQSGWRMYVGDAPWNWLATTGEYGLIATLDSGHQKRPLRLSVLYPMDELDRLAVRAAQAWTDLWPVLRDD